MISTPKDRAVNVIFIEQIYRVVQNLYAPWFDLKVK